MMSIIMLGSGALLAIALLFLAFSGPSQGKAYHRRLDELRERHSGVSNSVEKQMRKMIASKPAPNQRGKSSLIPNPELLAKRIQRTGKSWTLQNYVLACIGIAVVSASALMMKGAPVVLGLLAGLVLGLGLPHMVIGFLIGKRIGDFNLRFPDAIELMVRGLRSGLPISETLGIVGKELPGAVGNEFQFVADKIRIGRTMDEALQDAADRLNVAEFQFFCISLAIQRETGGNLAETLSNLADVLRKRSQMKLKIRAMSSESKASAYIVGSLPFIVFGLLYTMNPGYIGDFFIDERLMIIGLGGLVWMGIGVAIMAKMVSFEI
jgi:tight adherence protein B